MAIPSGQVSVRGCAVSLTDMECGVLRLLLEGQGRPLGRTAILERLHAGPMPELRIVDVFVCRLRAKLAQAGLPGVIGTVWRQGYVLQVALPPPGWHQAVPAPAHGLAPALRAEVGRTQPGGCGSWRGRSGGGPEPRLVAVGSDF